MGCRSSKEIDKDGKSIYEKESLADHEGAINCMSLSQDGSLLITGSDDCTARMWSTKTDETEFLGVLEGHTDYITCVASFATFVLTGSADATIRKWSMATRECLFTYEGHESRISQVICTGTFVFSSSYDKTACVWPFDTSDIVSGSQGDACIHTFKGHHGGVYPIIFLPAPSTCDSDDDDDAGTVSRRAGDLLITGSTDCTAKSWSFDAETSACVKTFRGHTGAVFCMTTDRDSTLFTAGPDSTIKVWDIDTAICQRTMDLHTKSILCMQLVNKLLYSGSADHMARCWVADFGECTRQYKSHTHSVICIKVADGVVFTGCGDTHARAFDAKSGTLKRTYMGHESAISCIQYIDGKLYTGGNDGVLKVWEAKNIADDPALEPDDTLEGDSEENVYFEEQSRRIKELEWRLEGAGQLDPDIQEYERELAGIADVE